MIDITMPALSPTMETGTLSKWLVKVGDAVKSGDVLAEIETDKATMEVESIDEGVVAELVIAAGSEGVPVGQIIMRLSGEGEGEVAAAPAAAAPAPPPVALASAKPPPVVAGPSPVSAVPSPASPRDGAVVGERIIASPLAKRIAEIEGIDLAGIKGTGPNGRIVRADIKATSPHPEEVGLAPLRTPGEGVAAAPTPLPTPFTTDIPHTSEKLGNVRKVIARRLTEAKQTVPHFYLSNDIRIDALLKLRSDLNAALEPRKLKLSVNDMVIKALALALRQVPKCNVSFAGDSLISYTRADISVAVAAPSGLITPIIVGADGKPLSVIASEMQALAAKARDGKLQPHEYQGGTASVSNLGMYGIKQFDAVINPPQGMILAVGAGEKRAYVVNDALAIATVMTVTGSFDHRAIDGADGAELMAAVKALIESPLGLVA